MIFFSDLLNIYSPSVIYFLLLSLFNVEIYGTSIKIVVGTFYIARFLSQKKWRLENPTDRLKECALKHRKNFCKKTPV